MHTRVIVLAGGKGKRMASDIPKVALPFRGKPLARHLIDAIIASGVDTQPVVVVGHQAEKVKELLGNVAEYVLQEEQLGTGHAVGCTEPLLREKAERIIVLYGDHPFVRSETIQKLAAVPEENPPTILMATAVVPDFREWRVPFYDFGRIVRDEQGAITRIVEKKDATEEELRLTEVNLAFFNFDAAWLWSVLPKISNQNASGEFYLTDLIALALAENRTISTISSDPRESMGVNTPEHLSIAEAL